MKIETISFITGTLLMLSAQSCVTSPANSDNAATNSEKTVFTNPLLDRGADPWSYFYKGRYYYMNTVGDRLELWETTDLTELREADHKTVWRPEEGSKMHSIWAPEIHRIDGKWYIYVSIVDPDGVVPYHQMYVLENASDNPMEGTFVMKGRLQTDNDNNWAIDASVFEIGGELYATWSGWPQVYPDKQVQCIYIAHMSAPWTIDSERVLISKPEYDWETNYKEADGRNPFDKIIYVNEGPQPLISPDGKLVHIIYSASGVWTPYYQLGLLTADASGNLLDPKSWKKSDKPVFSQNPEAGVYAPGHNSFFMSPDSSEYYILYHARDVQYDSHVKGEGRSPRAQKFTWRNGYPVFGVPVAKGVELNKPSAKKE